jgi:lipopolysaccharide transport system ATP-binding protein
MSVMQDSDKRPAVKFSGVRKEYRLYDSISQQAIDVLGLSWLRFWRPIRYRTFTALDGIDLEIRHGERVGIVGRNGAGKTTLLKLITRNFVPTAGEIEINGDVQALMQTGLGFHGEFTGYENIKSSLIYSGLSGDELESAVNDIVDFCELGDFLNQPLKTYSLGMRTRLQFAAATAIKPGIVIIDEVLGAGDAYFAGKSSERIKRLTSEGATLLIVSHSMAQILQFSNRAIWMDKGQIVASGKPLDIVNQYEEFIHQLDKEKDLEKSGTSATISSPMKEVPEWILKKNEATGSAGADWGGTGPLRIASLSIIDETGNPTNNINTDQSFGFLAEIISDQAGTFPCSCLFVMYNETGDVVTRVVEAKREYRFDGDCHRVLAWFDDNPIGQGNYILSGGLYRDYDPISPARGQRYHILSRGCELRIVSRKHDNSRIVLAPSWKWKKADIEVVRVAETARLAHAKKSEK